MNDLRFYNTLSRQMETFQPIEPGKVKMYHCGPTVYQRPHIGNYRAFLLADLLRRLLEAKGFEVTQVMNLTDVGHVQQDADAGEDKLESQAKKERIDPWELVERVSAEFFEDLRALHVLPAHEYPRATQHIPEMVAMIERLLENGHAYQVGENVYFDVHSFDGYGALSGNRVEELEAGARLEINPEKRHPADFALWKSDERHVMKWDTRFGQHGFPGWHIECSAMSMRYLGEHFDIHTGGEDNVFPHHECEIAQSEAATGKPFVNLWMHTKFLQVDGGKMSKSLGNVYTLDDIREQGLSPLDFRFLVLRAHYRGSMNFTWEALKGAAEARRTLADFVGRLRAEVAADEQPEGTPPAGSRTAAAERGFWESMEDDMNSSAALAALFDLRNAFVQRQLTAEELPFALRLVRQADDLFVFLEPGQEGGLSDDQVEQLLNERKEARARKDFARSDEIRDELASSGIVIEDRADGTHWHRG